MHFLLTSFKKIVESIYSIDITQEDARNYSLQKDETSKRMKCMLSKSFSVKNVAA